LKKVKKRRRKEEADIDGGVESYAVVVAVDRQAVK
jgi:hypothetical protein